MKNSIFIAQESSQYFGKINYIPLVERGLSKILFWTFIKINWFSFFGVLIFLIEGVTKNNISIIHQNILYFHLLRSLTYPHLSFFRFLVLICTMGKKIGRFFKYNILKLSTLTIKKPFLSSSDAHKSSASNLTWTSISSQLDNKDITTNQNKNNTSNIDGIHSCVTPWETILMFSPHLQPLVWSHWTIYYLFHLFSHTHKKYPLLMKNIFVFVFMVDLLMLPSVSNHG